MRLWAFVVVMFCSMAPVDAAYLLGLAAESDGGNSAFGPTQLFSVQLDGTGFTEIGPLLVDGMTGDFDAIAASPAGGVVAFHATPNGSRLVLVDPVTATAVTQAPPLFGREMRGAAFDSAGHLWAVDAAADELFRVSPQTGEALGMVPLTLDGAAFEVPMTVDLAANADGSLLLAAGGQVLSVDVATGALTELFTDSTGEPDPPSLQPPTIAGIATGYTPTKTLFALDVEGTASDDLYTYDLAGTFDRELLLAAPLSIDLAIGDLAIVAEPVSDGDYNGDGTVNLADYTVWRDTLGSATNLAANGDDSGTSMNRIDAADYLVWKNQFEASLAAPGSALAAQPVPEPSAWPISLIGITTFCAAKRRFR